MGLFDWLFRDEQVEAAHEAKGYFTTLTAYRPHFTTWRGEIYESELVRAAIDARARNISKLKVEILGSAKPTLQTQLRLRPNTWQTWSQFLYRCSTILDMQNTLVIVPVYDRYMTVVGYYPVLPKRCEVIDVNGEAWLRYEFHDGKRAADRWGNVAVLTRFQYKSDFFGESNHALDPTMKLVHIENEGIEEAVKNGATFRFMARVNNFSKAEDLANERKRFNETNLRADEEGGLLLFPNTYMDIKQIDSKPYTPDENERNYIKTNVYNYFGVNEDVMQSKAYGDAWAAFYESVIEPFAIQFSETMTAAAFTDRERSQGSQIMLTSNRLQYLTTSEKLNVSAQLADRGILNRDEVREIWNLPPLPNGEGQAYIIRGEYYNADGKINEEEEPNDQE
ncbi:MAG: phage portal protein [Prevotella sp.]|nr:phage portal protein [Prevotella sp.]